MNQPIARKGNHGQALIEYVMAVLLCIGMASVINSSLNKGIAKIWTVIAKNIAPGCPGCTPPDDIK